MTSKRFLDVFFVTSAWTLHRTAVVAQVNCEAECMAPSCAAGGSHNAGLALVDGTCEGVCSPQDATAGVRYCGPHGNLEYMDVGYIDCRPCKDQCQGKVDIVFVLDGSSSVSVSQWGQMKDFVVKMASQFRMGEQAARAAVVEYSDSATLHCSLNSQGYDIFTFWSCVESLAQLGAGSCPECGLSEAKLQLEGSGNRAKDAQFVFLVATGSASAQAVTAAREIEAMHPRSYVFSIAVGSSANVASLSDVASPLVAGMTFFYEVADADLVGLVNTLMQVSCSKEVLGYCSVPQVPNQASSGFCSEGMELAAGSMCTPQCQPGYGASQAQLDCSGGVLSPNATCRMCPMAVEPPCICTGIPAIPAPPVYTIDNRTVAEDCNEDDGLVKGLLIGCGVNWVIFGIILLALCLLCRDSKKFDQTTQTPNWDGMVSKARWVPGNGVPGGTKIAVADGVPVLRGASASGSPPPPKKLTFDE
jgi:hypothetical protein